MDKNKLKNLTQFDIWLADLPKYENTSIQYGIRPVVIMSGNDSIQTFEFVTVLPFTTQTKNNLPCHVNITTNFNLYGLKQPSTILGEQILKLYKYRLINKLGSINDINLQRKIFKAMYLHLGYDLDKKEFINI